MQSSLCARGAFDNSPQFQLRVRGAQIQSVPAGRLNFSFTPAIRRFGLDVFSRPAGAYSVRGRKPAVETAGYFRQRLRRKNEYSLQGSINYFARPEKHGVAIARGTLHHGQTMMVALDCFRQVKRLMLFCLAGFCFSSHAAPASPPKFNVIACYTGRQDLAHIRFVQEANRWFPKQAEKCQFSYGSTTNWNNLNTEFLV